MKKISLLIIFSFLLVSCALMTGCKKTEKTKSKKITKQKIEEVKQKLQGKENIMTFDEAIKEFGAPDGILEGEEIIFTKWILEKSSKSPQLNYPKETIIVNPPSGTYLEMIFDKKTKLLKEWKIEYVY